MSNSMTDPTNARCFDTDPHAPHRTTFAPAVGIANFDCPGIDCPDWCTYDHTTDDRRDDLVLHQGDEHTDGTVRRLLAGHALDIRVARTDCPSEGRTGVPALMVRAELELTTWEQAAELARTILDSFGYLKGADQA